MDEDAKTRKPAEHAAQKSCGQSLNMKNEILAEKQMEFGWNDYCEEEWKPVPKALVESYEWV